MTTMSKTHPLNAKQVRTAFGISQVTLYLWRKGTEKRAPLPHKQVFQGGATRVTFKQAELEKWAKKHGVAVKVPFAEVATEQGLHQAKPGPKPSQAPTAAKKSQQASGKAAQKPAKLKAPASKPEKAAVAGSKAKSTGQVPKSTKKAASASVTAAASV